MIFLHQRKQLDIKYYALRGHSQWWQCAVLTVDKSTVMLFWQI